MTMNYFVLPGLKNNSRIGQPFVIGNNAISHIPLIEKNVTPTINIRPKSQSISFNIGAVRLMGLEAGMRVNAVLIGQSLFLYKCLSGGYAIFYQDRKAGTLKVQVRSFLRGLQTLYHIKRNVTFDIEPRNYEYQFSKLYEVMIPSHKRIKEKA